jgi:hypothetical protein
MKKQFSFFALFSLIPLHCLFAQLTDTGDKVGIGTTNPLSKFHLVDGSGILRSKDNGDGIVLTSYSNSKSIGLAASNNGNYGGSGSVGLKLINGDVLFVANGTIGSVLKNNGNLGIGTTSPGAKLEVNGEVRVGSYNSTTTGYGNKLYFAGVSAHTDQLWISRFNIDNVVSELRVNIGDDYGDKFVIGCHYWNGGAWTPTMTVQTNGKVGIGTSSPDAPLTVAGNIHAREIKVTATAGGADFVFADDYALPKLEAVAAFVKQNKHLPEIPSAAEMEANGLHLAEMNIKLLQKVEELTLYAIEQENKLAVQEKRATARDQLILQLLERIEKLEEVKN